MKPEVTAENKDALRREVKSLLDDVHEARRAVERIDFTGKPNFEAPYYVREAAHGIVLELLHKFEDRLQEIKQS